MGQQQFLDIARRYDSLHDRKPLVTLALVVSWELLRANLHAALATQDLHTPAAKRKVPPAASHNTMSSVANIVAVRRDGPRAGGKRVMLDFRGSHFEGETMLWAARRYFRYGVSY
jgi:hypothetical protein